MYSIGQQKRKQKVSAAAGSAKTATTTGHGGASSSSPSPSPTAFPRAPSDQQLQANPALKPASLLKTYCDTRLQDDQREEDCSLEQLKQNNSKRQQILLEALRSSSPRHKASKTSHHDEAAGGEGEDEGGVIDVDVSDSDVDDAVQGVVSNAFSRASAPVKKVKAKKKKKVKMSAAAAMAGAQQPPDYGLPATNRAVRRSPSPRGHPQQQRRPPLLPLPVTAPATSATAAHSLPGARASTAAASHCDNKRYIVIDGSNVAMA